MLFKRLTRHEEFCYRLWARENHLPMAPINGVWHPVVIEECRKIDAETGTDFVGLDREIYPMNKES